MSQTEAAERPAAAPRQTGEPLVQVQHLVKRFPVVHGFLQRTVGELFDQPEMPYAWGLLGSIPRMDRVRSTRLTPIPGSPPSLINLPSGCSFHPRCPYVREAHKKVEPTLEPVNGDGEHRVACLLASSTRQRIWAQLREGRQPDEARAEVELEERPA